MSAGGELPRRPRFAVSRAGTCSFCGKRGGEASAFAGIPPRPPRICGECLGLCLDVTCEQDKDGERQALAAQLTSFDPGRELYERLEPKLRSGDIDDVVEVMRELGHGDADPDEVRAVLGSLGSHRYCSVSTGQRGPAAKDACSFCDSARDEVAKLLRGPGVTICDRCIDDASAEMLGALTRAEPS